MKLILLLFPLLFTTHLMQAQSFEPMSFAGPSTFGVAAFDAWQQNDCDTIQFQMVNLTEGNITLPSMTYNVMGLTIPSFTIHNVQFEFDMDTFSATFPEQTYSETITVAGAEKAITGYSLSAQYNHDGNTFQLETVLSFGSMPVQVTYKIEATYIADAAKLSAITTQPANVSCIYDLTGRQVNALKHGRTYIIHGRKVVAY